METSNHFDNIKKTLIEKGPLKVDVYQNTEKAFNQLKVVLKSLETDLQQALQQVDNRVVVKFSERGPLELEFRISDDILIFTMHTDVFTFQESNFIWKNSYLSSNKNLGYCGIISVYNFLTDSLKFKRVNDVGTLIARVFINRDNHFFAEGKKQLGVLFNNFETDQLSEVRMRDFAEVAVLFSLNFDVIAPPFEQVKLISVGELIEQNLSGVISTGKRLGFKLQSETDKLL